MQSLQITKKNKFYIQARKELEKEKKEREKSTNDKENDGAGTHAIDKREFEHSGAVSGVYFTCELLGDDEQLTKNEVGLFQVVKKFRICVQILWMFLP